LSYVSHANVIYGVFRHKFLLFTSCGRLSSKLYNICLPAVISTLLDIMDTVKTVKVLCIQILRQFYGMIVTVY